MKINSFDYKSLSVDTEKGPLTVFLPIGLDFEQAQDICANFTGVITNALKKFQEEKEETDLSEKKEHELSKK